MIHIDYNATDFEEQFRALTDRPAFDPVVDAAVARILETVRELGDQALVHYAKKFDGAELTPDRFRITEAELEEARQNIDPDIRKAIRKGCTQIREFSEQRVPKPWSYSPRKGVIVGERFAPLNRVAAYVPGGTAPLISTVLHTVTLASTANVEEIVVVTPPGPDGKIHPAILYAANHAGATEIYRLGGVYAVAALAYGTESIRKVEKIVGPGNAYVTSAKKQVYGEVSLDLVAGPSEIMILADESADPAFIAADMLSQIEHGSGHEQAVLTTDSKTLINGVKKSLLEQIESLQRADFIRKCLHKGVVFIEVPDLDTGAEVASRYAPEHLEIICKRPGFVAKKVTAAGAIFLGPWTPEPVGDFVAGPSHVLPTGGAAKYFSGLTIEHFFRRMSVVNYQRSALNKELEMIEAFAEAEGLDAHGRSASIRFEG
jgi:histidinol dehydrogenase